MMNTGNVPGTSERFEYGGGAESDGDDEEGAADWCTG